MDLCWILKSIIDTLYSWWTVYKDEFCCKKSGFCTDHWKQSQLWKIYHSHYPKNWRRKV